MKQYKTEIVGSTFQIEDTIEKNIDEGWTLFGMPTQMDDNGMLVVVIIFEK